MNERSRGAVVIAMPDHTRARGCWQFFAGQQAPSGRSKVLSQKIVEEKVGS